MPIILFLSVELNPGPWHIGKCDTTAAPEFAQESGSGLCRIALWDCLGNEFRPSFPRIFGNSQ